MKTLRMFQTSTCRVFASTFRHYYSASEVKHGMFKLRKDNSMLPIIGAYRCMSTEHHGNNDSAVNEETAVHMFAQTERKVLFPNINDQCLEKLVQVASVPQLMSIIQKEEGNLSEKHSCQLIVTLSDLKKESCFSRTAYADIKKMLCSAQFQNLCSLIEKNAQSISYDVLITTLYCAKFLDTSCSKVWVFSVLFDECWKRFPTERLTLFNLSILSASVTDYGLKGLMLQSKIIQVVQTRIKFCKAEDDLRHITSIVSTSFPVVTSHFLESILIKCEEFLMNNEINNASTALACIQSLVSDNHDLSHARVTQQLYECLKNFIPSMPLKQLIVLFLTLRYGESDKYDLLMDISARAETLLQKCDNPLDQLTLLNCISASTLKEMKAQALETLGNVRSDWTLSYHGTKFTRVLRNLRCSDTGLVDSFWADCLALMASKTDEQLVCKMYLRFKFSFPRYEHRSLHTKMKESLLIRFTQSGGFYPEEVALIASFFIIVGKQPLPDIIFERVVSVGPQLSVVDIETLSKCLKLAFGSSPNRKLRQQLLHISNNLDDLTAQCLRHVSSLPDVRRLSDACLDRQRSVEDGLFFDIMDKYHTFLPRLSSRSVLAISHQIGEAAYFCPTLLDGLADFIVRNIGITGWTAANFLYACYKVSYLPQGDEEFIAASTSAINRDYSLLTCLKILQAAVALSLFRSLPLFLVHGIFNTDFLEKLDHEMEASLSTSRTNKFRRYLFELNRIVCLEYPEWNIPWFHEKYGDAMTFQAPFRKSNFESDVLEILTHVLGGQAYCRANVFTPYYYHLHFESILDDSKSPLALSDYGSLSWGSNPTLDKRRARISADLPPGAQRVAINVLNEKAYCSNVRHLKGAIQMKRRHLEIMNYKVVEIPYFEWYSMQLADRQARLKYIEKKLFNT